MTYIQVFIKHLTHEHLNPEKAETVVISQTAAEAKRGAADQKAHGLNQQI